MLVTYKICYPSNFLFLSILLLTAFYKCHPYITNPSKPEERKYEMSWLLKPWKRRFFFFWIMLQATCQGPSLPALFSSFYSTLRNISILPWASSSCSYLFSVILQRSWLKLHGSSQALESEGGQTMSNWDLGLKPKERNEDTLVCLHYLQLRLSGIAKRIWD